MAELIPAPFGDLVTRLFEEPSRQGSLFELPRRSWYAREAAGPDLSVSFHGRRAGNAAGPAAGPHTQMAQNLLLSYAAGARILELKTVQVDDRLTIGRPCIDMTNVGYNIEWSQELRVADSLGEYAAGAMLIEMFRRNDWGDDSGLDGAAGAVIHDISVGYDLAGIQSEKVRGFLEGMRDAGAVVERLRADIPRRYKEARDAEYPKRLSHSVTLSTFHGCPADEIERICEFLIGEYDFDVIVKMNPPMLGKERLEHLLFDVMGYTELTVNPKAYTSGLTFDEALAINARLQRFAAARGRRLGFKFSNTLEVMNHRKFFTPDNRIMYLSGQPLHVITLTLTEEFRNAVGPDVPISFSAGIDRRNFPTAVACGIVPVTISTDLLRPGGYARLPRYLAALREEMTRVGAANVDEFMLRRYGHETEARRRAQSEECADTEARAVLWAGLLNTAAAAAAARADRRYYAAANRNVPKRMDRELDVFDCITCDKCLPVCPNAANFTYPTPVVAFDYADMVIAADGTFRKGDTRSFEITESMQIACYADFCNECGNCDTFCPEYGGPYIKKPSFFGSVESWRRAAPRDGFVLGRDNTGEWIRGRIRGREYALHCNGAANDTRYTDGKVEATISPDDHAVRQVHILDGLDRDHVLDMGIYHTFRHLHAGALDSSRVNQVNAGWVER